MIHHHETELSFVAYIIALSVLIGACIISATVYVSFRTAGVGGSPTAIVAGNDAGTTVAAKTAIDLPSNTPYLGNPNAKVTVVEYADYRCPFCEKFFTTV